MCELSISDLRCWVHLGCSSEEKMHAQPVRIDIELTFANPPKGTQTDELKDTICYQQMVELAQTIATQQAYNLIEHLAFALYQAIQQAMTRTKQHGIQVKVKVHKLSPPIANVLGGISFSYAGEHT